MAKQTVRSSLLLVPWPETEWSATGRLSSRTPLPLTDRGRRQARAWSAELVELTVAGVYSADEQASKETAEILMGAHDTRHKIMPGLAEVDIGLWEGLTSEELNRRYPKVYKRWREEPQSVCPPEGESVSAAQMRITEAIEKATAKLSGKAAIVVLGPLAFGLARESFEHVPCEATSHSCSGAPIAYDFVDTDGGDRVYCVVERVFADIVVSPSTQVEAGQCQPSADKKTG